MRLVGRSRIIFRMDTSALMARIGERLKAVGLTERAACLRAGPPVTVDSIRTIKRGHAPRREVLRRLATVLDCPLGYLEEVAPDLRLNSRADAEREELIGIYEKMPPPKRGDFLNAARALARLATEAAKEKAGEPARQPRKKGQQ